MNILPNLFSTYFLPLRRIGTAADRRPETAQPMTPKELAQRIERGEKWRLVDLTHEHHERRHAR